VSAAKNDKRQQGIFSVVKSLGLHFAAPTPRSAYDIANPTVPKVSEFQNNPVGSDTVAFFRFVVAALSSFVIVQRTPSTVLRQAFASSDVPRSHISQSSSANTAGQHRRLPDA
jgi:hypothetical protein